MVDLWRFIGAFCLFQIWPVSVLHENHYQSIAVWSPMCIVLLISVQFLLDRCPHHKTPTIAGTFVVCLGREAKNWISKVTTLSCHLWRWSLQVRVKVPLQSNVGKLSLLWPRMWLFCGRIHIPMAFKPSTKHPKKRRFNKYKFRLCSLQKGQLLLHRSTKHHCTG